MMRAVLVLPQPLFGIALDLRIQASLRSGFACRPPMGGAGKFDDERLGRVFFPTGRVSSGRICLAYQCTRTTDSDTLRSLSEDRKVQEITMSNAVAFRVKTAKRPNTEKRKVGRTRDYLTPDEVEKLIAAAVRAGRYGHRDATLMLLAYRHGLRCPSWSPSGGSRWTLRPASSTSTGTRTGFLPSTRCGGLSCAMLLKVPLA